MMDLLHAMPDKDYYRHGEPPASIMDSVQADGRPYLALVGAPGVWDVAGHPALPLLGVFKTNDRDNAGMPASTHWQLLLTAPGGEELAVLPWKENDKLPPAKPIKATPPPPGSRPKTTYSFAQEWRDVEFSRLPEGPRAWKAVLLAGNFLSNPVNIAMTGLAPGLPKPVAPAVAAKPASAYPEAERKRYAADAAHPPLPDSGVAFAQPVVEGPPDRPIIPLRGSFRLPDAPPAGAEALRLHLLFSGPDVPGGLRKTLAIPLAFVEIRGAEASGRFQIDLAALFRGPSGKVVVPAELYVTAIRGSYIGRPTRVEAGKQTP